jgi:hypothetical protein
MVHIVLQHQSAIRLIVAAVDERAADKNFKFVRSIWTTVEVIAIVLVLNVFLHVRSTGRTYMLV